MGRKAIKKHLRDKEATLKFKENKIKELQGLLNDKNKEIKDLQKPLNSKAEGLEQKTTDEENIVHYCRPYYGAACLVVSLMIVLFFIFIIAVHPCSSFKRLLGTAMHIWG